MFSWYVRFSKRQNWPIRENSGTTQKKKHRNRLLFSTVSSLFSIKTRSRVLAVLEACFSRVGFSSASLLHIHRLYLFQKLLLVTWRQSAMVCGSNIRLLSLNKPGEVLCDRKLRGTVVQTSSANHVTVKLTRSYLNASFTTETSDSRSSSGRFLLAQCGAALWTNTETDSIIQHVSCWTKNYIFYILTDVLLTVRTQVKCYCLHVIIYVIIVNM